MNVIIKRENSFNFRINFPNIIKLSAKFQVIICMTNEIAFHNKQKSILALKTVSVFKTETY